MTDYLKSLYEAAIVEKKTKLHLSYIIIFIIIFVQLIILIRFVEIRFYLSISLIVCILLLSFIDKKIEQHKQMIKNKKEKLFYEIFYPEMFSSQMLQPFKLVHDVNHPWPYQNTYFTKIIHVHSENLDLMLYHFKIHQHQKPTMKILFKFPFQGPLFDYLNHQEDIPAQVTMLHHHYLYQAQEKNTQISKFIDTIERCPHLLDVEIIFNGQDAMFMCKIESVTYLNDFKTSDKTFKKHEEKLNHIYPVYQYINQSLKELEDAYRK